MSVRFSFQVSGRSENRLIDNVTAGIFNDFA